MRVNDDEDCNRKQQRQPGKHRGSLLMMMKLMLMPMMLILMLMTMKLFTQSARTRRTGSQTIIVCSKHEGSSTFSNLLNIKIYPLYSAKDLSTVFSIKMKAEGDISSIQQTSSININSIRRSLCASGKMVPPP